MVDNVLARAHPTSPTTDTNPMDNLPMDNRPMGNLRRRGRLDGCEKITVRRRCIILTIIIVSRRVGPGAAVAALAAVEAISTTGPCTLPTATLSTLAPAASSASAGSSLAQSRRADHDTKIRRSGPIRPIARFGWT